MAETKMQLADWLDDLCVRFIVNLPQEELESVERICFQVEEAQWYYEDFIRPLDATLPSLSLKTFCMAIFQICPFLSAFSHEHHLAAYAQFLAYKTRVPVRGAILLNKDMDHVLLVKGWKKGASWSFPRGKINKDEEDIDCAMREVYEETGYDLSAAGPVPNESDVKSIEVTMREQHMKLYVFRNVPMDTNFQARTRKEISKIAWWKLSSLPGYQKQKRHQPSTDHVENDSGDSLKANRLYMVAPFLPSLRKWINQQRRHASHKRTTSDTYMSTGDAGVTDGDAMIEEDPLSDIPQHQLAPMAYDFSTALPQMVSNSSAGTMPLASQPDAAAQMKRMLGVIDPLGSAQDAHSSGTSLNPQQQDLLSMLTRSRTQRVAADTYSHFLGALNQVEVNRDHLRSSMQQQSPLSPPSSSDPMLNFPLSLNQPHAMRPYNENSAISPGNFTPLSNHPGPPSMINRLMPSQVQPRLASQQAYNAPVPIESGPNYTPAVTRQSTQPTPVAPLASQLPQPKLNSHAANLLSMFKTDPAKPRNDRTAVQAPMRPQADEPISYRDKPPAPTSGSITATAESHPQNERKTSRAAFGTLVPSTVSPPTTGNTSKPPVAKPLAEKKKQDTLLSLFKQPSEVRSDAKPDNEQQLQSSLRGSTSFSPMHQRPTLPQTSKTAGRPPVAEVALTSGPPPDGNNKRALLDLLRKPSEPQVQLEGPKPAVLEDQADPDADTVIFKGATLKQGAQARSRKLQQPPNNLSKVSPTSPPRILQRPQQSAETSALPTEKDGSAQAVKPQVKDQGSTRRRGKAPKTALQKAEQQLASQQKPVQILKRPSGPPSHIRNESGIEIPSVSNTKPSSPAKSPAKPFTPQILKRPKPDQASTVVLPPAQEEAQPQNKANDTQDQKQTLLALLGTKKQGNAPSASPAARRLSTGVENEQSSSSAPQSPGARVELSRSRISSVASPPGGEFLEKIRMNSSSSIQRVGTPLRSGRNSASSQTPISPADRGFLVNYLEGVIGKGGAK